MIPPPRFLDLDDILEIHGEAVAKYGGSPGVRDMGLLQSALAAPQSGSGDQYFHTTIHEMAAAYLFHLVQNHPFIDGNKRTGAMAALAFLDINGIWIRGSNPWLEELTLMTAQGKMKKAEIAEAFRKHSG